MHFDIRLRGKLYGILALLVVSLVLICFLGGRSILRVQAAADEIYSMGLVPVVDTLNLRTDIADGRALLNSLLAEVIEARQRDLHKQILTLSARIDTALASLAANPAMHDDDRARIAQVKGSWENYKKLREEKIVPFIFEGDLDSANASARNVLAERYATLNTQLLAMAAVFDADSKTALSEADSEARISQRQLWALSLLVLTIATIAILLLARSIRRPIETVATQLEACARETTNASETFAASSQSLAEDASQQAASLEEISASLTELTSMTERNADNARKANTLSKEAHSAAEQGGNDIRSMCSAMEGIRNSSTDIARIIKTIDEIAFQTNILALNAAVEAARAGEAGAGFAVVAEEVRALAQRSATAARESASMIGTAIERTNQGVSISKNVSEAFERILSKTAEVDKLDADVDSASHEQSQGIHGITNAVAGMDTSTQNAAARSEETAGSAQELKTQAARLADAVASLKKLL